MVAKVKECGVVRDEGLVVEGGGRDWGDGAAVLFEGAES